MRTGVNAYRTPANAGVPNSSVAAADNVLSGAPRQCNDGAVRHPDVVASNGALWAHVGDPYDALARGGA